MPENPLLPHRRLKELYSLMKRVQELGKSVRRADAGRETVLAAAAIQLEAGDILFGPKGDAAITTLAHEVKPQSKGIGFEKKIYTSFLSDADFPALCMGAAVGMKLAANKSAVIALVSSNAHMDWSAILQQAQTKRLPLLLIVTDRTTPRPTGAVLRLSWLSLTKLAKKLHLPTISVDGEDAVAIYRTVQESIHRARLGDGPAVIWCSYPQGSGSGKTSRAVTNMESYLAARGLVPKKREDQTSL